MRAVNLIPSEERRGESAPMRTGPIAYLIVGVLALVLLAMTAVTLLNNDLSEKRNSLAALEQQGAEAEARAASLQPFVEFEALKAARVNTVSKLATSRFDWERVMNELALVLPIRVWLTELSGTVVPGGGEAEAGGGAITGPSLTLAGCARSQRGIARLVTSLEDIDGVTRVLAENGEKGSGGGSAGVGGGCQTRDFVAAFNVIVAFDEVAIDLSTLPAVPPSAVPPAEGVAPTPGEDGAPTPDGGPATVEDAGGGGVAGVESQKDTGAASVAEADGKVREAKNLATGGSE